jgi:hypothetical protein
MTDSHCVKTHTEHASRSFVLLGHAPGQLRLAQSPTKNESEMPSVFDDRHCW